MVHCKSCTISSITHSIIDSLFNDEQNLAILEFLGEWLSAAAFCVPHCSALALERLLSSAHWLHFSGAVWAWLSWPSIWEGEMRCSKAKSWAPHLKTLCYWYISIILICCFYFTKNIIIKNYILLTINTNNLMTEESTNISIFNSILVNI